MAMKSAYNRPFRGMMTSISNSFGVGVFFGNDLPPPEDTGGGFYPVLGGGELGLISSYD